MTRRKSTTLTVTTYRLHVVEETETEDGDLPSLPAQPIYETTGESIGDTMRPVAKCETRTKRAVGAR